MDLLVQFLLAFYPLCLAGIVALILLTKPPPPPKSPFTTVRL